MSATPRSVSTLDVTEAVVSSMPGTTAVATARAAADASTRIRNRMPHLGIAGGPGRPHITARGWQRPGGYSLVTMSVSLLPAEMYEQPAVVLGVLLDPVVQGLDLFLIEKPEHPLFQLARALARDDFDHRRLLRHRLVNDGVQRPVNVIAPVVDVVQVQLELHRSISRP